MGCLQSSGSVSAQTSKEQRSALVAANPADTPTSKADGRKAEFSSLKLNDAQKKENPALDPVKVEELRQPVKRREFAKDEQGSAFDILKKRVESRRFDMNAHRDDDDLPQDNNNVFD